MDIENLEAKSDSELSEYQALYGPRSIVDFLCQNEWQRRDRESKYKLDEALLKNQHELNLIILEKQLSITKVSIIVGFAGILAGVILGAALENVKAKECNKLQELPSTISAKSSRTTSEVETSLPRKEKAEP